jgi:hypothetical protein
MDIGRRREIKNDFTLRFLLIKFLVILVVSMIFIVLIVEISSMYA